MEISNIEKYFIDLSKCSEEQRKHIFSLLPDRKKTVQYWFDKHNILLYFDDEDGLWWVNGDIAPADKTEITYPEFIKLFEGGEETEVLIVENCISIEELTKLCNDYNRNTLKITNLERDLEYKRSWSKESIAIKAIYKEVSHAQAIKENAKSKLQEIGIVF